MDSCTGGRCRYMYECWICPLYINLPPFWTLTLSSSVNTGTAKWGSRLHTLKIKTYDLLLPHYRSLWKVLKTFTKRPLRSCLFKQSYAKQVGKILQDQPKSWFKNNILIWKDSQLNLLKNAETLVSIKMFWVLKTGIVGFFFVLAPKLVRWAICWIKKKKKGRLYVELHLWICVLSGLYFPIERSRKSFGIIKRKWQQPVHIKYMFHSSSEVLL
jgi:hypothetical protein